jgi:hypothetical protein
MEKGGVIKTSDVVNIIVGPKIQALFQSIGMCKPSISVSTARRWLETLGWRYGRHSGGMYVDGHERADVVEYRRTFVSCWVEYEKCFHFDTDGIPLPVLNEPPTSSAEKFSRLILVTHDESTFFQNDMRTNHWGHQGISVPKAKGEGQSLMVSDFLTAEWGPL